jgi:hypothetical protein
MTNAWTGLEPDGEAPPGVSLPYFVYDPALAKSVLLVQGFTEDGELVSATWIYDSAADRWTRIKPVDGAYPPVRLAGSLVWCSDTWGLLFYGGSRPERPDDLADRTQKYIYPASVWTYSATAGTAEK